MKASTLFMLLDGKASIHAMQNKQLKKSKEDVREATQADIDAFAAHI